MNTKRIRRIALCVAIAFAVVAFAAVFVPVPPHGRFTMTGIGVIRICFLRARLY